MESKLTYIALIEKHNLNIADLPQDARDGIKDIKSIENAIDVNERNGKPPKPTVLAKLARLDKWVRLEIIDFVNETEDNNAPAPVTADAVIKEIESDEVKVPETTVEKVEATEEGSSSVGHQIDKELESALKSGKTTMSFPEIKTLAPVSYKEIWDSYDKDGKNGIETTHYSLIETDKEVFVLSKK